jgi:hypothetical protein
LRSQELMSRAEHHKNQQGSAKELGCSIILIEHHQVRTFADRVASSFAFSPNVSAYDLFASKPVPESLTSLILHGS